MKKFAVTALVSTAAVLGLGMSAEAQTGNYPPNYPPATTAPVPTTQLPATGSDGTSSIALIAASLLGAGGVMVVASQARRRSA